MNSKLLITLIIIILIGAYAYFGVGTMQERNEQALLASQIADASDILAQVPEPPQDLEQRLADVQISLAAEEDEFPGRLNSTQIINTILELADDSEVKAIPLVTQPWSMENVGERPYYVFRLNIAVQGTFSQLLDFTTHLETGAYETLIVEDLSVTRVAGEDEDAPEGTIPVTADMNLAIYTKSQTSE